MIIHDYMMQQAVTLQQQAADLSRLAREYAGLGPAWTFYAGTMQKLAQQHYEEARTATRYIIAREVLRRSAQIVGRG